MTMIERFVKERNEALFSLDIIYIEVYLIKYVDTEFADTPDLLFWAGVYKAICGIKSAPPELVDKAHGWLTENGFAIPA